LSVNLNRLLLNNYFFSQIICYILIIPGFGMISHVIGTMSDKSVFGQYGPKNILFLLNIYFLQRTNCRKLINIQIWILKVQNTIIISNKVYFFLIKVKIFVFLNNPQITYARVFYLPIFKLKKLFEFSMLVGISETIRSLLIFFLNFNRLNLSKFSLLINLIFSHLFFCFEHNKFLVNNVKYSFFIFFYVHCHFKLMIFVLKMKILVWKGLIIIMND
jgi:hypothetical protein